MTPVPCRVEGLEPLPPRLLRQPLDYILADHLRHRVLCQLCDQLADAEELDVAVADQVLAHISEDLAIHVIDEEQDLFPLLRRRAIDAEDLDEVLGRLSAEHASDDALGETLVAALRASIDTGECLLSDAVRTALRTFAHDQRHHIALENATVMPLAKALLSAKDLKSLGQRMAARRGVLLEDGPKASERT